MDYSEKLTRLLSDQHDWNSRVSLECRKLVEETSTIEIGEDVGLRSWNALMAVLERADVSKIKHLSFPGHLTTEKIQGLAQVLYPTGVASVSRFSELQTLHLFNDSEDQTSLWTRGIAEAVEKGGFYNLRSLAVSECDVQCLLQSIQTANLLELTSLSARANTIGHIEDERETYLRSPPPYYEDTIRWVRDYRSIADTLGIILERGQFLQLRHLGLANDALGEEAFGVLVKAIREGKLPALRDLDLTENPNYLTRTNLAQLVIVGWFDRLETLNLGYCVLTSEQIVDMVEAIIRVGSTLELQILHLKYNRLGGTAISAFVRLSNLDLMPQLQELDLSYNPGFGRRSLSELRQVLQEGHLPSLQELNWEGNVVGNEEAESIVVAYSQNKAVTANIRISWEYVTDISLRTKAAEFRDQNVRLRQIKEKIEDEDIPVTTAKVFLCGFSGVGKTTLRKSLKRYLGMRTKFKWEKGPSLTFFRVRSTRGIELCRIQKKNDNDILELILWDLAGQEEFHVMHGTFLPDLGLAAGKATTFVVVFAAQFRKSTEAELLYWLRFVASSSLKNVKRQVVIVLNCFHSEPCPDNELSMWKDLIERFRNMFHDLLEIHGVPFLIDVRIASSVKELKNFLFARAGTMLEDVFMPRVCLKLLQKLKSWSEGEQNKEFPILSWDSFEKRLESQGELLTGKPLKVAATYLHEYGEIIYFSEEALEVAGIQNRSIVVSDPEWFCRGVVGHLLLPKTMLEKGESSVKELLNADGSIRITHFQAYFRNLLAQDTQVQDVISMLIRVGLCYRMGEEKILIPALIQIDDFSYGDWEGKGVQWVMARSLAAQDQERTAFPMTLFRRLQVELAQDRRFGGRGDSGYRAGKSYSNFKIGGLLVLIQFDTGQPDTTGRVDILVKSLVRDGHPSVRRLEQIDCICAIMQRLESLCVHSCPGVKYDRKVIKPWNAADETCKMSKRELMFVREIQSRIQDHGLGKYTSWDVDGVLVKEETLLSLGELEEVQTAADRILDAHKEDIVAMGLLTGDHWSEMEDWSDMNNTDLGTVGPLTENPLLGKGEEPSSNQLSLTMDAMSPESDPNEVLTKAFFHQQMKKGIDIVSKTVCREGKRTRGHLDKRHSELHNSLLDIRQKQNLLLRHVQSLQTFSIQERERSVPRYMFLSKLRSDKSSVWITLTEGFQSAFELHLLCEARYDDGIIHEVLDQEGIEIKKPKEWLVKISPWLRWSLTVAAAIAKLAGNAVLPGLGGLIPDLQFKQGIDLTNALERATGLIGEKQGRAQGDQVKYGSAKAPVNLKERMIAEAVLGDLMLEVGQAAFVKKMGLRRVLLNKTLVQTVHSQAQPCVVWICHACYFKYGDSATDITPRN